MIMKLDTTEHATRTPAIRGFPGRAVPPYAYGWDSKPLVYATAHPHAWTGVA
jgi:hypothetical protein